MMRTGTTRYISPKVFVRHQPYAGWERSGFTMMELLVAIAIITVIVVAAIPNFVTFNANMWLKGAADDLFFTLQQTRINAIRGGGQWMVKFGDTSYQVVNCVDNDCTTTPNSTVKTVPYSHYVGISFSDTFSNHTVVFTADGMVSNPSALTPVGKTTMTNSKGTSKTISILESGIIRIS